MKKFTLFFILVFVLTSIDLKAQVYFAHGSKTYQFFHGTDVFSATWNDDRVTIPIGFDFEFRGEIYNELDITETTVRMSNFGGLEDLSIIPFNAKTVDRGHPLTYESKVTYLTSGNEGQRIFTVQWENTGFEDDLGKQDFVNVQISLHQFKNKIEITYGDSKISNAQLYFDGAGPKVYVGKGLPFELYPLNGDANQPEFKISDLDAQLNNFPAEGQYYLFSEDPLVGIKDNHGKKLIEIYPNPFNDKLYINKGQQEPYLYEVYSLLGEMVASGVLERGELEINLDQLSAGTYILYLNDSEQIHYRKIVKSSSNK